MLIVQFNVDLKAYNTLALSSIAEYFVKIDSLEDVVSAVEFAQKNTLNIMVLSGGSNVLLPARINALVLKMEIQHIGVIQENDDFVWLNVGAGQVWHDFVLYTTEQGYYGLQNLALIPGLVGASPVQNIGAYGVEVGEFINQVAVFDREEMDFKQLTAEQCQFSYRHSIFKQNPQRYIIVAVQFKLLKSAQLKLNYGDVKMAMGDDLSAENLQRQIIKIRQSKLPDPKQFANVGSFFKNPVVSMADFVQLQAQYPQIPHYSQANGEQKLAAGWLIEQTGWKGKKLGKVGMFERQALVLVNYADADLADVQATYRQVQQDVWQKFAVQLEPEPVLFNEQGLIINHS